MKLTLKQKTLLSQLETEGSLLVSKSVLNDAFALESIGRAKVNTDRRVSLPLNTMVKVTHVPVTEVA